MENVAHWHRVSGQTTEQGGWHRPLWNPYIFNCRTKDEMLVCLKYELSMALALAMPAAGPIRDVRKNF